MMAEQGTSATVDRKRPATDATSDMRADSSITGVKRCAKTSAVIIGSDMTDISIMMPTRRIVRTMHSAVSTVIV